MVLTYSCTFPRPLTGLSRAQPPSVGQFPHPPRGRESGVLRVCVLVTCTDHRLLPPPIIIITTTMPALYVVRYV